MPAVRGSRSPIKAVRRFPAGVAIFPCKGPGEWALGAAFDNGGAERVTPLYRRDDLPQDQCWLRAPDWCLAYR